MYNFVDLLHTYRIRSFFSECPIDLVIDVGSHKGEFMTSIFPDRNVEMISFEPQASVRNKLIENTQHLKIIEYYSCAVSDRVGHIQLHLNNLSSTSSNKRSAEENLWMQIKRVLLGGKLEVGTTEV